MITVGQRIRAFAKSRFGSMKGLAEALKISPQALSPYANNKLLPGARMQQKFRAIGCDIEWLMTGKYSVDSGSSKTDLQVAEPDVEYTTTTLTAAEKYFRSLTREQLAAETAVIDMKKLGHEPHYVTHFVGSVGASLDNPIMDIVEETLNARDLISLGKKTYMLTVRGESMIDAGVYPGDKISIDTELVPEHNDIVVANIDGHLVVKRLKIYGDQRILQSERGGYPDIILNGDESISIFGVVESAIKSFLKRPR